VQGIGKRFVYIIASDTDTRRHYVGVTQDVEDRLDWHNHGPSGYTVKNRPWSLVVVIEFTTEKAAIRFEKYLKSGSGRAFASRHFGESIGQRP
jgi:putative endonuclease